MWWLWYLPVIFVIRGVIFPIVSRIGGKSTGESQQVQADAEQTADPTAAQRQPLKGQSDLTKVSTLTPGWHEDDNGRWYQNADGTYYTGGFAEIDGVTYAFDDNGYMQTGMGDKGSQDYYFNDDGSYNASEKRPMIARHLMMARESIPLSFWTAWKKIMHTQPSSCLARMFRTIRMT